MINYYTLLGINRNVSEEKLFSIIDNNINILKTKTEKLTGKDKMYALVSISLHKKFLKTVKHYGSKEVYDKALGMSYDKVIKLKVPEKKTLVKIAICGTLVGTIIGGIAIEKNLTTVEVKLYSDDTIESLCEEFGIKKYNIHASNNKLEKSIERGESVEVVVSNDKALEIQSIAKERREEVIQKNRIYKFKYLVQDDDTISGLKNRFNAEKITDSKGNERYSDIWSNETIIIYTKDQSIAEEMEVKYEEYLQSLEPIDFVYYEVKQDDTVGKIVNKYGITRNALCKYNTNTDGYTIYAGSTLRIPVYEKENVKAK